MDKLKIFKAYNQITKLFDVTVMSKQQITNLKNDESFLVLLPKKHVDNNPRGPRKPRVTNAVILKKLEDIEKRQFEDHNLLLNIIKLNHLKTK